MPLRKLGFIILAMLCLTACGGSAPAQWDGQGTYQVCDTQRHWLIEIRFDGRRYDARGGYTRC